MKAFCSNSVKMRSEDDYDVCRCLGHDVGQPDVMHPWKITYANDGWGVLHSRAAEKLFLKKAIEEMPWVIESAAASTATVEAAAERLFQVGHDGQRYYAMPGGKVRDDRAADAVALFDNLLGQALRCHWTYSRASMTHIQVWRHARRVTTGESQSNWLLFWTGPVLAGVRYAIGGGECQQPPG